MIESHDGRGLLVESLVVIVIVLFNRKSEDRRVKTIGRRNIGSIKRCKSQLSSTVKPVEAPIKWRRLKQLELVDIGVSRGDTRTRRRAIQVDDAVYAEPND